MVCGKSNKNVDEDDKLYTNAFFQTKKMLLLGTGESGKTTIIKQMKILHINGFSEEEKKEKIPFIRQNIHESIYDIVGNMGKIDPPVSVHDPTLEESVDYIIKIGPDEPSEYTDEYFDQVQKAWSDKGVKETYERSNEFQLIDSAAYFLDRLAEIRQPNYIPTVQDILYCRIMTVAISKIEFSVPVPKKYGGGTASFWMFDVGGQRGQRKKWIQVFDGIQAILFLIAASDFDQTLREDKNKNRLEEAFSLFENICRSRFVRDAGLIVFLNKQDILKKKIEQGRRVDKYFPEYRNYRPREKDVSGEYDKARLFMRDRVDKIAKTPLTIEHIGFIPGKNINEELPIREVYTHFTIATDTNNIKKVFNSVHEIILKSTIDTVFSL